MTVGLKFINALCAFILEISNSHIVYASVNLLTGVLLISFIVQGEFSILNYFVVKKYMKLNPFLFLRSNYTSIKIEYYFQKLKMRLKVISFF